MREFDLYLQQYSVIILHDEQLPKHVCLKLLYMFVYSVKGCGVAKNEALFLTCVHTPPYVCIQIQAIFKNNLPPVRVN